MAAPPYHHLLLFLFCLLILAITVQSQVPPSKQFKALNTGEFGEKIIEYDASYRLIGNQPDLFRFPFGILFYNTTPDAYILGIRMGRQGDDFSYMRWVWEANRLDPVRENATLTLGSDGNLVLADVDGRVVWHTNTANKGATGVSLLENGNLVVHDSKGKFLWQSFDHPTDALLIGQSLRPNGPNKLVSRFSDKNGNNGIYSLVLEPSGLNMYYQVGGEQFLYGGWQGLGQVTEVRFNATPETAVSPAYDLELVYTIPNTNEQLLSGGRKVGGTGNGFSFINLVTVNYNATFSYLKLGSDGNVRIHTYYPRVDFAKWAETFSFFSDDSVSKCSWPKFCGSFGLCDVDEGMCVSCPSPKGLLGWSRESCKPPPKVSSCKGARPDYYKVVGVQNFLSLYSEGKGPMSVDECKKRCSGDCKCVGVFYKEESSMCLTVPILDTLIKESNTSHVGYIKYYK
eukprot:TRINITY_DN4271_c1_g1_i1.p1 TRINITY_DN4271_c1_g1~~TRINITY_DN4271_c1_g1_i1.p1  ORF type:complete len:456 (-),score=18.20 TRINITY_DN4271_c1_g1_i1:263-1630(-)